MLTAMKTKFLFSMCCAKLASKPLEWSVFLSLLKDMSAFIAGTPTLEEQFKYASLQTGIALSGYLGLNALELLNTTWKQIYEVDSYTFVYEIDRSPLIMEAPLQDLVRCNYQIIKPVNFNDYIMLQGPVTSNDPVTPSYFIQAIRLVFQKFQNSFQSWFQYITADLCQETLDYGFR